MFPFGHVLSLLVPVYNLMRFYSHFGTIRSLRIGRGLNPSLAPGLAVLVFVIALVSVGIAKAMARSVQSLTYQLTSGLAGPSVATINSTANGAAALTALAGLLYLLLMLANQRGLNGLAAAVYGESSPRRPNAGELVATILLVLVWTVPIWFLPATELISRIGR